MRGRGYRYENKNTRILRKNRKGYPAPPNENFDAFDLLGNIKDYASYLIHLKIIDISEWMEIVRHLKKTKDMEDPRPLYRKRRDLVAPLSRKILTEKTA